MQGNWKKIGVWAGIAITLALVARVASCEQQKHDMEAAAQPDPMQHFVPQPPPPPPKPHIGGLVRMHLRAGGLHLRYRLVDLGPFDEPSGDEINMNDADTITMCAAGDKPYLWKAGKRTLLPISEDPPYDLPGYPQPVQVLAVNDNDVAVGSIAGDDPGAVTYFYGEGVLWKNGNLAGVLPGLSDFPVLSAVDINDEGEVLCQATVGSLMQSPDKDYGDADAYLVKNGKVTDLGESYAVALNNRGEVAGWLNETDHDDAALWTHGHWIDLGDIHPLGINDHADVVGYDAKDALLWRRVSGRGYRTFDLGSGNARGINNRREIVGNHDKRAVLWWRGHIQDLNQCIRAKGWVLAMATHINQRGDIIGFGKRNGKDHGFLLIPKGR